MANNVLLKSQVRALEVQLQPLLHLRRPPHRSWPVKIVDGFVARHSVALSLPRVVARRPLREFLIRQLGQSSSHAGKDKPAHRRSSSPRRVLHELKVMHQFSGLPTTRPSGYTSATPSSTVREIEKRFPAEQSPSNTAAKLP